MSVFIDTSAILAVMVAGDAGHEAASRAWQELLAGSERLLSTNYVLVETCALLQRRYGTAYLDSLRLGVLPVLHIHWVTPEQHEAAFSALLTAGRRDLSLVDCVSFAVMRDAGITHAFTLDAHFAQQGFSIVS